MSRPGAELAQVLAGTALLLAADSALRAVGPGLPGHQPAALARWLVADVLPLVEWLALVALLLAALRYAGALGGCSSHRPERLARIREATEAGSKPPSWPSVSVVEPPCRLASTRWRWPPRGVSRPGR